MHEIMKSLSLFVGTGECNANCADCAGIIHRKHAPRVDGEINAELIRKTLKECYANGARRLSLTSSGEPTLSPLSVTRALELVNLCKREGVWYNPINIYSNGIRIGEDQAFSDTYLPNWRDLGLTTAYITVHNINEKENARIYRISSYPSLQLVFNRIHSAGLKLRANLVLRINTLSTLEKFVSTVTGLRNLGADAVSAWAVRGKDDKIDSDSSPPEAELDKMEMWTKENTSQGFELRLLRENHQLLYQTRQKLTLFPDGTLSNTWCS